MDIEFIGYVIKIGNYYFGGRTQNSISVYKKAQQAEIFNEDDIDEVQVIYNGDAVSAFPSFKGKCTFNAYAIKYENLDVITKVIGIIGKHFKNWEELN